MEVALLRRFGFLPFTQRGAVHEKQIPSWREEATVRPRRQGRRGVAFTEAKRKPLTEEAGGAGAEFSQEEFGGKQNFDTHGKRSRQNKDCRLWVIGI
jgi:hypothetical protein